MALTKMIMMVELLLMIMFSELHSEREQRGQLGSQFEVQPRSSAFPDTQVAPRVIFLMLMMIKTMIRKGSALLLEDSSLHFSSLLSLLAHYSTIWYHHHLDPNHHHHENHHQPD